MNEGVVGRTVELATLDALRRAADAGEPQVVVFGGEAGVGKTRLIEHATNRFEDAGALCLRTRCVELGAQGLPLVPVTTALRQLVSDLGADQLLRLFPGAQSLLRLLPELAAPDPSASTEMTQLVGLFTALLQQLGAAQPVVWLIDDLQWADRSTRDLIGFLARTLDACQVVLLGAYRTDDLDSSHPLRTFLADIRRVHGVHVIQLGRFGRAETAELVADATGTHPNAELVDRVFRRSAGNALYAMELALADSPDRLPESLRDLLLMRIRQLPPPLRDLLRLAAVGGRTISHNLMRTTSGLDDQRLLQIVDEAVAGRVLVAEESGYGFRHILFREAVLEDMLPADRSRLHRVYADALEADPALTTGERFPAEVGFHLDLAGEPSRAVPFLLRAAEQASRVHAYGERAQLIERGLELRDTLPAETLPGDTDWHELYASAAEAAIWAGDHPRALSVADSGLRAIDVAGEPARAAMLLAIRAMALHHLDRDGSIVAVDEALEVLPDEQSRDRATVLYHLAAVLVFRGRPERALELAEEAVHIGEQLGDDDLLVHVRTTLGWVLAEYGDYVAAETVLRQTQHMPGCRPGTAQHTRNCLNLATSLLGIGHYDAAIDAARNGLDSSQLSGMQRTLGASLQQILAASLAIVGQYGEAVAAVDRGLEFDPAGTLAAGLRAVLAEISLVRGDVDAARRQVQLAFAGAGRAGERAPWNLAVRRQQAEVSMAVGDRAAASAALADGLEVDGPPTDRWALLTTAARHVASHRGAPDSEQILGQITRIRASLRSDTPALAAYAAECAAELGEQMPWTTVVDAWDTVGHRSRAAQARLRAAAEAAAGRDLAAAHRLLTDAAITAQRLEAAPLLDEIRRFAHAAHLDIGESAPPSGEPADEIRRLGLTDREREVLQLVAAGSSNRQIAADLYISAKTVSTHISNILTKLGVASRGEAAATAHKLGLVHTDADR